MQATDIQVAPMSDMPTFPYPLRTQHTTAFLVHAPTGRLLRTFYDFDGQLGQLDAGELGEQGMAAQHAACRGRNDAVMESAARGGCMCLPARFQT